MKVLIRALGRKWHGEVYGDSNLGVIVRGFWFPHSRGFTKRTNLKLTRMSSRSTHQCDRDHCLDSGYAASFRKGTVEFTNLSKFLTGEVRRISISVPETNENHSMSYSNRVIASATSPLERLENWMDSEHLVRMRKG